ncbi:MAG: DUF1579 family protein [Flavobacteriales bacterium]|nr:DUF1579 family protein [Flavobacteriales bacterium]MCC6939400.1 DUF1579 family protein [Flavobacteriales bacterium]
MKLLAQLPYRLMMGQLLTLLLMQNAMAQTMEQPEAVQRLLRFAGRWETNAVKFVMGDQHFTTAYSADFSTVNNGTGLMMEEATTIPGVGDMKGMSLFGWDPNLEQVHLYSIDNLGTCHDHAGYWTSEQELFLEYQGVQEGKVYVEQIWITLVDAKHMKLKVMGALNGVPSEQIEGTFTRKAA